MTAWSHVLTSLSCKYPIKSQEIHTWKQHSAVVRTKVPGVIQTVYGRRLKGSGGYFLWQSPREAPSSESTSTKSKHGLWDSNQGGHVRGLSMGNRATQPLPLLHVHRVAVVFGSSWGCKNCFLSRVKDLPGEGRVQGRMTLCIIWKGNKQGKAASPRSEIY